MFEKLRKELNQFLMKYYISINTTIFEDVLLALVGMTTPKNCQYGPVNEGKKMYFAVKGLNEEEAIRFLNLFKINFNDTNAFYYFKEELSANCFEVDTEIVYKKILPVFKAYIQDLYVNLPAQLEPYQAKSVQSFPVKAQHLLDALTIFEKNVNANHFLSDLSFIVPVKSEMKSIKFSEVINNFKIAMAKNSLELKNLDVAACQLLNRTIELVLECDENNRIIKDFQVELKKFYDALPEIHSASTTPLTISSRVNNKSSRTKLCKLGLFALSGAVLAYGIYQQVQLQNKNDFNCFNP